MAPKAIHILIPGTYKYGTLNDKMDFIGMVKLNIWGWEIILDYLAGALVVGSVFVRGR